ncbi:MAG: hypothetical protein AAF762_02850 [Pseudomonadota bacterium]
MTDDDEPRDVNEVVTNSSREKREGVGNRPQDAKQSMHNVDHSDDSINDPHDAAEQFLRDCIEEVSSEFAKKRERKPRGEDTSRADAALIRFITTYAAAHPDQQQFLRSVNEALSSLTQLAPIVEESDV